MSACLSVSLSFPRYDEGGNQAVKGLTKKRGGGGLLRGGVEAGWKLSPVQQMDLLL